MVICFDGSRKNCEFRIRRNRGTSQEDIKKAIIKYASLSGGKFRIDAIKDAFTSELSDRVRKGVEYAKEKGWLYVVDGSAYEHPVLNEHFPRMKEVVEEELRGHGTQWIEIQRIVNDVTNAYFAPLSMARIPPGWRIFLTTFSIAALVSEDRAEEKFENGKHFVRIRSDAPRYEDEKMLFFKIRENRGTTDRDIVLFLMKLLVCCRQGLSENEIMQAFTQDMKDKIAKANNELVATNIILENLENDGEYRFIAPLQRALTEIENGIMNMLQRYASHALDSEAVEREIKKPIYEKLEIKANGSVDSYFHNLFLAAVARLELSGRIKSISVKFAGRYLTKIYKKGEGFEIPEIFSDDASRD